MNVKIFSTLLLVLTAFIWGTGVVAQSIGAEHVGSFTFLAIRSWLSACTLLPLAVLRIRHIRAGTTRADASMDETTHAPAVTIDRGTFLVGSLSCGALLFASLAVHQTGIPDTTVAKAGFISSLYIVVVPVIGLFFKRRAGYRVWLCVAIAVAGLHLLCFGEGDASVEMGDILMLRSSYLFAVYVLVIDRFAPRLDGVLLSLTQFIVCATMATVCMLAFETPTIDAVMTAGPSILYAGILSGGIGYTLQIIGQKGLDPTVAGLAMSLESVFAALSGWLILDQTLTCRELTGCALMFVAIIVAQLPDRQRR